MNKSHSVCFLYTYRVRALIVQQTLSQPSLATNSLWAIMGGSKCPAGVREGYLTWRDYAFVLELNFTRWLLFGPMVWTISDLLGAVDSIWSRLVGDSLHCIQEMTRRAVFLHDHRRNCLHDTGLLVSNMCIVCRWDEKMIKTIRLLLAEFFGYS